MNVTDKDHGAKKLLAQLGQGPASILVGVIGEKAETTHEGENPQALTVGEIGGIHELGLGVPERSWLRAWVDENDAMIRADLRAIMRRVIAGKFSMQQGIEILGVKYVGLIQTRIAAGIDPPNSDATKARKDSTVPLIDTGQFRSAITYLLEQMSRGRGGGVTL